MSGAAHDQLALVRCPAGPAREPGCDELLGELVELSLGHRARFFEFDLGLGQCAAAHMSVEEIRSFGKRGRRQPHRNADDAVLDLSIIRDQDHHRALGLEPNEFDMLQSHVRFRGQHHPGGAREARQHAGGFVQHGVQGFAGGSHLGLHLAPVGFTEVADLHQCIDEEAQAELGRQPSSRGVRRINEAELLQVRHHVAHGCRRQRGRDQA